jgi:hypothetical protein
MGGLKPTVRMDYPLLYDICSRIIYGNKLMMIFQVIVAAGAARYRV